MSIKYSDVSYIYQTSMNMSSGADIGIYSKQSCSVIRTSLVVGPN